MSAQTGLLSILDRGEKPRELQAVYSAPWLSQDQETEWDTFVLGHPSGSVYHTTEWKSVIERAFPHIRRRFLVLRDGGSNQIRGGLPVYRVSSWLLGRRLVSIPFATACDPLVSTLEEWNIFTPELELECGRTKSKKLVIRAVLTPGQLPTSFGRKSPFRHHAVPLDRDFDALCLRFDKQSVRQKAEKARRAGVIIKERGDKMGMAV